MAKTFEFKQFTLTCLADEVHPMGTDSWLLGASVAIPKHCEYILDIGTGSGVVALMMAQRAAQNKQTPLVHAIDIHNESIQVAENNFQYSPWSSQMKTILGDINHYETILRYDLIVCNPPYFKADTISTRVARHRARHTSNMPTKALVIAVQRLLAEGGRFYVIVPVDYGKQLEEHATLAKLYCNKITQVYASIGNNRPVRLLMQFSRDPFPFVREELTIAVSQNEYSAFVKKLLKDFFINL